jgi:hypothetical protein
MFEGMDEGDAWQSVLDAQGTSVDGSAGPIEGEEELMFSQSEVDDNMAVRDHGKSSRLADDWVDSTLFGLRNLFFFFISCLNRYEKVSSGWPIIALRWTIRLHDSLIFL